MSGAFQLTSPEPRPEPRRAYQFTSDGGGRWLPMGPAELARALEALALYPDNARARIDAGETVKLHPDRRYFARRTGGAVDRADNERQLGLLPREG